MLLVEELAQYLHERGLVVFDQHGVEGDTFIAVVPATPDEVIVLTPTGGLPADSKLGYDEPTFQVRGRSGRDPRDAYERLRAIYGALQGLAHVELPGGTFLHGCWALQSDPVWIGQDANGRHEYTQNYRTDVRRLTAHRMEP